MLADEKPRDSYLGASELPGVCGLDPYNPRFEVWSRLTGRIRGKKKTPDMRRGIYLEPVVREHLPEWKDGIEATEEPDFHVHPELDFIGSHNDGYVIRSNGGGRHTMEIKNPGRDYWHVIREQGLPAAQVCQAQIGAGLRDDDECDFVMHNADEWLTLHFEVPLREELFDYMIRQGELFWHEHVLKDVPPDPFPQELPPDVPKISGEAIQVHDDEEWTDLMEQYARYSRLKKQVQELYDGSDESPGLKDTIIEKMIELGSEQVVGDAGKAYYRPEATRTFFSKELLQAVGPFHPDATRETLEWWFRTEGPDNWQKAVEDVMTVLGRQARIDVQSEEFYREKVVPYFRVFPSKETE